MIISSVSISSRGAGMVVIVIPLVFRKLMHDAQIIKQLNKEHCNILNVEPLINIILQEDKVL